MKINPDAPWYPCPFEVRTPVAGHEGIVQIAPGWHPGVTIRLKLAAENMKNPYLHMICNPGKDGKVTVEELMDAALSMADTMIKRANRDEGKQPE